MKNRMWALELGNAEQGHQQVYEMCIQNVCVPGRTLHVHGMHRGTWQEGSEAVMWKPTHPHRNPEDSHWLPDRQKPGTQSMKKSQGGC